MRRTMVLALALLALTTGVLATDLRSTGPNEEAWRACIAEAIAQPSGDREYEQCDALYDPDQTFRYYR